MEQDQVRSNLAHFMLSLSEDSCLQTKSVNLKATGNKQTGRKVRVHLVSLLKVGPARAGGHHNRKGWTDSRGSAQGRSKRLRRKLSMTTVRNTSSTTREQHTHVHSPSRREVGEAVMESWKQRTFGIFALYAIIKNSCRKDRFLMCLNSYQCTENILLCACSDLKQQ